MPQHLNLISYFGGKYPHLNWIISKLPAGKFHFVDIMCGAANVALNVNYPLITVNDINQDIINLFNILRDQHDEFIRQIYFTPFSREEMNKIVTDNLNQVLLTPVERARRYFTLAQLSFGANGSQNNHFGAGFEWAVQKSHFYRVKNWNLKINRLAKVADRLRHFQIESRDARELFDDVNKENNIVYWDPPYLLSLRKQRSRYKHEVGEDFHYEIAEKTKNAKCFVAISGYDSPLYTKIFKHLHKSVDKAKKLNCAKSVLRECLWTNYDPETINGNYKLNI